MLLLHVCCGCPQSVVCIAWSVSSVATVVDTPKNCVVSVTNCSPESDV